MQAVMSARTPTGSIEFMDESVSAEESQVLAALGRELDADLFSADIRVASEINEVGPLLLLGAAALALIAVFGGITAACKYMCSPKTVKTCNMDYFPTPKLKTSCYE